MMPSHNMQGPAMRGGKPLNLSIDWPSLINSWPVGDMSAMRGGRLLHTWGWGRAQLAQVTGFHNSAWEHSMLTVYERAADYSLKYYYTLI